MARQPGWADSLKNGSTVKISIMYPAAPEATFDMEYSLKSHMRMSMAHLPAGRGFRGVSVERGAAGPAPGTPPPFVALCHFLFESVDDVVTAFTPHAAVLQRDMQNYTDIAEAIARAVSATLIKT